MDARWPTSNPHLVGNTAGIWTLACLCLNPGPCLYVSCLCSWGRAEKGPSPLDTLSCRPVPCWLLFSLPADSPGGRQKDKSARVGTLAKGRHGDGRPAGRGQGSGQTRRGLLACWATLRKPDHIRPQEFPGPVLPQRQWERTSQGLQPPCWNSRRKTACHLGPSPWAWRLLASPFPSPRLQGLLFCIRSGCEGWWLQDPPRSKFSDSMALPHTGPGRKRKGVKRPTQLLKVPPPLPLSSVPTAIFRTDCREHLYQPCYAWSSR